jgi:hypothetical protein
MRPRIRTNGWLCIVSSIALVVGILSTPFRTPQTPGGRLYSHFLSRNLAPVGAGSGLASTSATSARESIDADGSDFDEEDKDESSWSFSHLDCPTSIPSDLPPKLPFDPRPGSSPPRTAAIPLRC